MRHLAVAPLTASAQVLRLSERFLIISKCRLIPIGTELYDLFIVVIFFLLLLVLWCDRLVFVYIFSWIFRC